MFLSSSRMSVTYSTLLINAPSLAQQIGHCNAMDQPYTTNTRPTQTSEDNKPARQKRNSTVKTKNLNDKYEINDTKYNQGSIRPYNRANNKMPDL